MGNDIIKVYGSRWCVDCFRAKRLLDKYKVAYEWIDISQDAEAKKFVGEVNNGIYVVPTIVFHDGSLLSEPSNAQLRNKLEEINKLNHV